MKKMFCFILLLLFSSILFSCAQPVQPTQTPTISDEMIGPGDKIGDMTVLQGTYPYPFKYPMIWEYCEYLLDGTEPASYSSDCNVPQVPGLTLSTGWAAEDTLFESSWNAVSTELYFDGYKLDLEQFEWEDGDSPEMGADVKNRYIAIYLENLTPGQHTFREFTVMENPVDAGFAVFQEGVYEQVVNFTVTEPEIYPTLSSTLSSGQHRYRSEEAQIDFLLYIPEDYGITQQYEWPLVLYLHGYPKGLASIDFITREGLPKLLETEANFPFIVVSPHRDEGYFEYWYQEENVSPMFRLLEEIQKLYDVDPKRIYLIGESAGGNGAWEIGLQYPERFAALVPVSGYYGYPFEVPDNLCDLKDVPIWAFHGAEDEVVPLEAEQMLVDALEACSGNVQFTIFPDTGHDIDSRQVYTSELLTWLLDQEQR